MNLHDDLKTVGVPQLCDCMACEEQQIAEFEAKYNHHATVFVLCVVLAAAMVVIFWPRKAHADFQAVKATVARQLIGSGATLSEYKPRQFTPQDIKKIKEARKQMGGAK